MNAVVVVDLDCIGTPGKPQSLRPQRDAPENHAATFPAMRAAVNATMLPRPPDSVFVVAPDSIAVDERALPGAVGEVFNGGDGNDGFDAHSRDILIRPALKL